MKKAVILTLVAVFACGCSAGAKKPAVETNQAVISSPSVASSPAQPSRRDQQEVFDDISTPQAIGECLRRVNVGEPFDFDKSLNPFYLRLDLFGDRVMDYAAVIKGQNSQTLGLLICKDAKEPIVLGELSHPAKPLTDMDRDNFIGAHWEVVDAKYLFEQAQRHFQDGHGPTFRVKGDVLVFSYEIDGILYFWWDGNKFETFSQ